MYWIQISIRLGLLNRQLCWYLTCDRYQVFAGTPSSGDGSKKNPKRLEAYLIMAVLIGTLAIVLVVIYYVMWLLFCQLESHGRPPPLPASRDPGSRPTHLPIQLNNKTPFGLKCAKKIPFELNT